MANGGRIDYIIGFKADDTGILKLKQQLQEINSMSAKTYQSLNPTLDTATAVSELDKVKQAAQEVQSAMTRAFNSETGVMNLQAFKSNLQGLNLSEIQQRFYSMGETGVTAFSSISKAALTTSVNLKKTDSILDKMGTTMMNTLKWSISSSMINSFTSSIQQAYGYVQHLDTSLNDIRIVTGKSADEMADFAVKANDAAEALGKATTDYTEASLIYYQQGLSDEEVEARTETTLKAASVTGQSTSAVSEELTAVWNGYRVEAEQTEEAVDKLAAVAATTAADLEELSTGMSKVAAAANNMGVDMDQLNATIATIESVTRQAPESVGTALKTIYARMGDLKIGDSDEDGLKLGDVSSTLQKVGIEILDVNGDLRDMGTVIEEIGEKWGTWSKAQQTAIAESVAGKRQYNNLFALFDNWDMYTEALETSQNSVGTLQKQQDIFMESTAAHIQQLKTEWEDLYDSVLDTNTINTILSGLTKILNLVTNIIDAIGGGKAVLTGLVSLVGVTFSKQIVKSFGSFIQNIKSASENAKILKELLANIKAQSAEGIIKGDAAETMTNLQREMAQYWHLMSEEEINSSQKIIEEIGNLETKKEVIKENTQALQDYFNQYGTLSQKKAVSTGDFLTSGSKSQEVLLERFQRIKQRLTEISSSYKVVTQESNKYNEALSKINSSTKSDNKKLQSLKNISDEVSTLSRNINLLHNAGFIDDIELLKAENLINNITQKITQLENDIQSGKRGATSISEITKDMEALMSITKVADNELQHYFDILTNGSSSVEEINMAIEGLKQKLQQNEYQTRANIEAWSNLVGGVSSLVFGFQSLSGAIDAINNEDLTIGEKVSQFITTSIIGLPMVVKGITNVNTALGTLSASTLFLNKATREEIIYAEKDTVTTWERVAAYVGLDAAMAPVLLAATAIAAVVGGVALVAWKKHTKELEKNAERAKANAEAQAEIIDKTKDAKTAIDDLANSYNSLAETVDDFTSFSEEQKNEIYELVKAYGDQELIVLALAEDYETLEKAIRKEQVTANEQLKNNLNRGITSERLNLEGAITESAGVSERDKSGYDLSGLGGINKHEDFRKDLQELIGAENDVIDSSGHIGYSDLIDVLTTDSIELNKFLDKYSNLDAADQIRELLSSNSETIDQLKTYNEEAKEASLSSIGYAHIEDIEEGIKDLATFEEKVDELAQEALEEGEVESLEEGREWAKSFIGGFSDGFSNLENTSYIADSILDAILPSDEEIDAAVQDRKDYITEQLTSYEQGGNVDLHNRPQVSGSKLAAAGWDVDEDSYGTVLTSTFSNEDETAFINFTPIIVDPETGEYKGVLSPTSLQEYAEAVIAGTQTDYMNLQIGSAFGTAEEAEAAAVKIHELHEELYDIDNYADVMSDSLFDHLEGLSTGAQSYVASHIDLFKSLISQGWSVDEVFENIQADIDAATAEDHIIKIDAVFEEGFDGSKFKEKIEELFADESFDIGVDIDTFESLDSSHQAVLLVEEKRKETEQILSLNQEQIDSYNERKDAIQQSINDEKYYYLQSVDEAEAANQAYKDLLYETKQQVDEMYDGENPFLAPLSDEQIDEFKEQYVNSMEQISDAYLQAEENGEDFQDEIIAQWNNMADQGVKSYITALAEASGVDISDNEAVLQFYEDLVGQWKDTKKESKKAEEAISDHEKALASYQAQLEEVPETEVDYQQALKDTADAIDEVNDSIDELQDSYQTLQDAVEEYNSNGYVSLDTLQDIITMDSSYVASLELVDGQLQLNDDTYQSLIDTQITYLKELATIQYMEELEAIAKGEVVTAAQQMDAAEANNVDSIQAVIDKANEGTAALLDYANSKVAADLAEGVTLDSDAVEEVTKAYENKLSLIDSLTSQSTSTILGDDDSSSSSSSSSSDEPDEEDYLEREVDLYREINAEIEHIESTLSRIQTIDEHAWGASAQKALEEENQLLDTQLEYYKEKQSIQEDDLASQQSELSSYGVTFNATGSAMTNAEDVLDSLYAEYNSMVDSYNSMSADEQDDYEDTLEDYKDYIDDIEDAMDDYEDTWSEYEDTLDDILDTHYELIENAVNQFNNMVDVHLDLNDAKTEWNDFWYDVVQDVDETDFSGTIAKNLANLDTLVGGISTDIESSTVGILTGHLNETIDEVWTQIANADNGGGDSMFGDDTALAEETLTNYRDQLITAMTSAKEALDNISESYLAILDDAQDKIDDQVEGWESIGDHIEHNIDLIKLIDGDTAYDALDAQYEQQFNNELDLLNTQKQSVDFWAGEIERYQTLLEETDESSVEWDTYSEALDKSVDNYRDAVDDLDTSLESAIKVAETIRTNTVNQAMDKMDKAMSGGLGLDLVEQEWKLIDEHSSKYLDNVERAYSMEDYENILEEAANATGLTAENQAKINQFMDEELEKLNAKEKLTKYDIEESKARLEILKQQIALEDAQANKSNMRLRRDSQGNYVYQYTGDDEQINDAEKGGLTARKEWYDLVKQQYKDTTDWILELEKNQSSLLTQIDEAERNGETERLALLKQMYEQNLKDIQDAQAEAEKNKQDLFSGTAKYFADVENAEILPQSKTTVRTLVDQWVNNEDSFVKSVEAGITTIENAQKTFEADTKTALETAGKSYEDLVDNGIDPTTTSLKNLVSTNDELATSLTTTNDLLTEQEANLRSAESAYNDLKEAAVGAVNAANECLETLAETAVSTVEQVEAAVTSASNAVTTANSWSNSSNTSSGSGSSNNSGSTSKKSASIVETGVGTWALKDDTTGSYLEMYGSIYTDSKSDAKTQFKKNWSDKYSFATGGYTGDWTNGISGTENGRLAVLHQKELVLNAEDTQNILQAVYAIRDLTTGAGDLNGLADSLINAGAMQAQILSQVGSGMLQTLANMVNNDNSNNQNYKNMTVNADFSGVRSADAIYQALMELENYGMQESYSVAPHMNMGY